MSHTQTILAAALAAALLTAPSPAATQTSLAPNLELSTIPTTAREELLHMAAQADIIFSGEVLTVTPHASFTPGTGIVEIAFRIDQPIRGCDGQATYTLREWAGLWTAGYQRYTPGQRLLVLLHAPSASGLGSPVGGQDGLIPVTGMGPAPKSTDTTIAQNEPTVDLRWVQARLPRATALLQSTRAHALNATSTYIGREHTPLATRKIALPGNLRSTTPTPSAAPSPDTLPLATSKGISLRTILAILGAWQTQQSDAPH